MRRTMAAKAVARALLDKPDDYHWGYSLAQETGLPSGALYPILARMEGDGWLTSQWADPDGSYPRRRYYQLTNAGRAELATFLEGVQK